MPANQSLHSPSDGETRYTIRSLDLQLRRIVAVLAYIDARLHRFRRRCDGPGLLLVGERSDAPVAVEDENLVAPVTRTVDGNGRGVDTDVQAPPR